MKFIVRVVINAIAIWLASALLSGLNIFGGSTPAQRVGVFALIALLFGVVNAIVKPIVKFFALPLYVLTLGLFTLVVYALMLMLTAWITDSWSWGLRIDSFGTAVIGAVIISIVSVVLSVVTGANRKG